MKRLLVLLIFIFLTFIFAFTLPGCTPGKYEVDTVFDNLNSVDSLDGIISMTIKRWRTPKFTDEDEKTFSFKGAMYYRNMLTSPEYYIDIEGEGQHEQLFFKDFTQYELNNDELTVTEAVELESEYEAINNMLSDYSKNDFKKESLIPGTTQFQLTLNHEELFVILNSLNINQLEDVFDTGSLTITSDNITKHPLNMTLLLNATIDDSLQLQKQHIEVKLSMFFYNYNNGKAIEYHEKVQEYINKRGEFFDSLQYLDTLSVYDREIFIDNRYNQIYDKRKSNGEYSLLYTSNSAKKEYYYKNGYQFCFENDKFTEVNIKDVDNRLFYHKLNDNCKLKTLTYTVESDQIIYKAYIINPEHEKNPGNIYDTILIHFDDDIIPFYGGCWITVKVDINTCILQEVEYKFNINMLSYKLLSVEEPNIIYHQDLDIQNIEKYEAYAALSKVISYVDKLNSFETDIVIKTEAENIYKASSSFNHSPFKLSSISGECDFLYNAYTDITNKIKYVDYFKMPDEDFSFNDFDVDFLRIFNSGNMDSCILTINEYGKPQLTLTDFNNSYFNFPIQRLGILGSQVTVTKAVVTLKSDKYYEPEHISIDFTVDGKAYQIEMIYKNINSQITIEFPEHINLGLHRTKNKYGETSYKYSSNIIFDDINRVVIVSNDNRLYFFDADNLNLIYYFETDGPMFRYYKGKVAINKDNKLYVFDTTNPENYSVYENSTGYITYFSDKYIIGNIINLINPINYQIVVTVYQLDLNSGEKHDIISFNYTNIPLTAVNYNDGILYIWDSQSLYYYDLAKKEFILTLNAFTYNLYEYKQLIYDGMYLHVESASIPSVLLDPLSGEQVATGKLSHSYNDNGEFIAEQTLYCNANFAFVSGSGKIGVYSFKDNQFIKYCHSFSELSDNRFFILDEYYYYTVLDLNEFI